jgi:hypothetical protein
MTDTEWAVLWAKLDKIEEEFGDAILRLVALEDNEPYMSWPELRKALHRAQLNDAEMPVVESLISSGLVH